MSDPNRLEREIEEILDRIEEFPDARARRRRAARRALQQLANAVAETQRSVARTLARFSVSQVMLLSFLLILGSLFLRRLPFTQWVLYLGIVLFVASFAILVFGGGRGSTRAEQNWRGRPVAPRRDVPTLGERLRGWWQDTTRR